MQRLAPTAISFRGLQCHYCIRRGGALAERQLLYAAALPATGGDAPAGASCRLNPPSPATRCLNMPPPNSCNQSSISTLNCDFVQRHTNGSFTSSSCRPCRQRHLHAAVLLLQPSSHAYFHFMFETLPRLQLALHWMKRHKNSTILVDAWHGNTWSAQALGLLGFGDKVVVRQARVRYSIGIAFIPPAPPIHHTFPAELNATVQQLLLAADAAAGIDVGRHSGSVLFIQRSSSDSQHSVIHSHECPDGVRMREVLNMKEVESALRSRFGSRLLIFRSYGLHLMQQIKAFRNASLVIGVHGRSLSPDLQSSRIK